MSSQIRQNFPTEEEAAVHRPVSLHLRPLHLPLQAFISTAKMWLGEVEGGVSRPLLSSFQELAREKREGTERLLKTQNQHSGRILFQDAEAFPRRGGQNSGCHRSHHSLGEEPEPGPLDLEALGSAHTAPHLCDFQESHFLDEEVRLIKKMGDHLTHLRRLAPPGWVGRVHL